MGRPRGSNQYKAQVFIEAIPGSGGIISTIAKRVGCSWHTAKKYITNYATVRRAYDDECEKVTDLAESVVFLALKSDNPQTAVTTAKWYLTMKARDRGYAPQSQVDVTSGGQPLFDLEEWKRKRRERLERIAGMEDIECGPVDS